MANIDNRKIEALELLINMFLSTGQYDKAKKTVRALRVLLRQRAKAKESQDQVTNDSANTEEQELQEAQEQAQKVVLSGALNHKAGRHKQERHIDIIKLEAVVNYFAQEYELCINLIERYEQEHNAPELLKIDFNQAQEEQSSELQSIIELRTMLLLKAKCLFLLGEQEQSRALLKDKLNWTVISATVEPELEDNFNN